MDKILHIKRLYEKAVEKENNYLTIYDEATEELGVLKQVALDNLHLATREVDTIKKILDILEDA